MGEELAGVVVNGGVGVVLAVVVMRWLRSDLARRAEECKVCAGRALGLAESERGDKMAMMEALQRNTEAITRLVDAVRGMGGNGRLEAHEWASGRGGDGEKGRERVRE